jgi:chromosome segregation ATPase
MSQTETLLLVALGFSLAALIALFAGRLLWPLAVRLGARRIRRKVPLGVAELQTERDTLRAEYAMLSQKLNSRLDGAKTRMAEQTAEVTRNRNRIALLTAELNDRDALLAAHAKESDRLRARVAELENAQAESQAAIATLRQEFERKTLLAEALGRSVAERDRRIADLTGEGERLSIELKSLEHLVADLDSRTAALAPLDGEVIPAAEPAPPAADAAQSRLRQRIDELAALSQQIAETRAAVAAEGGPAAVEPTVRDKLEQAARETEDLQKELARLDADWNARLNSLESAAGKPAPRHRAVANVISLANRIRSLQKDIAK